MFGYFGSGASGGYPFLFLPPHLADKEKLPFGYTLNFTGANVLAASGTVQLAVNVSSDADFVLMGQSGVVTSTDNATRLAYVPETVQINYGGSGRNFFDNATMFNNAFGDAELPFLWPAPIHLKGGGSLLVTLTNLEATARNVRLLFFGWKVFPQVDQGLKDVLAMPGRFLAAVASAIRQGR